MKPITFKASLLLFIYGLCACNNRQDNTAILQQIDEGLVQSNQILRGSTDQVLEAWQIKVDDQTTAEKAKLIQPKAIAINALSNKTLLYIDSLKSSLLHETSATNIFAGLRTKLHQFKQAALALDEKLSVDMSRSLVLFGKEIDSAENEEAKLMQIISNSSLPELGAYLDRIRNNIIIDEQKMMVFLFQQIAFHPLGHNEFINTIVAQNAKVLEADSVLEITAAMGSFRRGTAETIIVNKHSVPIGDNGLAIYKIKTSTTPGHYSIPVQIKFTDADGKQQTHSYNVEYKTVSAHLK